MSKRLPDYRVGALNKRTNQKGNVGAAWRNEDGTISLVLDPFCVIQQDGHVLITLFPEAPPTPVLPEDVVDMPDNEKETPGL